MNTLHLFILVLLLHFYSDFNLQIGAHLHDMKQKEWWERMFEREGIIDNANYRYDWVAALLIHSGVWSMLTFLPLLLATDKCWLMVGIVSLNTIVHAMIDHLKANRRSINLIVDQGLHFVQIITTIHVWQTVN